MPNVETWLLNFRNLGGMIDIPGSIEAPWDGNPIGWGEFAIRDANTSSVLAIAAGDFGRESVRTHRLQWRRPSDGKPIFRWTEILNWWQAPFNLRVTAHSSSGSYSESSAFLVWLGGPQISPYTTDYYPKLLPRSEPAASNFYLGPGDGNIDPNSFRWWGSSLHSPQQGLSFSYVNGRSGINAITCQYSDWISYAVERVQTPIAELSALGNPALTGGSTLFNSVNVSSGNLHLDFFDMKTDSGDGVRFELRRAYNSQPGIPHLEIPAPPSGEWIFNFECHARTSHPMRFGDEEPWPTIELVLPDGTRASYFLSHEGRYVSFLSGLHYLVEESFMNDPVYGCPTIRVTTQGTKPIVYTFCNRTNRRANAAFRLETIKDLRGNGLMIGYREGTIGRYPDIPQIAWVQDSTGRRCSFQYGGNRITSVTDFTGRSVSYHYDGNGNMLRYYDSVSTGNGSSTWQGYEYGNSGISRNRLISLVQPLGNRPIRTVNYDAFGLVTSLTDHNYATTWFQFNQNQTLVDRPGGDSDILFRLDDGGQVREIEEAYGSGGSRTTTLQRFDPSNFSIGPVIGSPPFYRTPDIGLVRNVQSLGGVNTSFSYSTDGRGFLKSTQEIGQPEMRIEYNENPDVLAKNLALPIRITDPRGFVIQPQWYTQFGDLIKMPNALGQGMSVFTFDTNGKPLITDDGRGLGYTTSRGYTWDGNLEWIQFPDNDPQNANSRTARYEYDSAFTSAQRGLPSAIVSRRGTRTELRWDANDRLIEVILPGLPLQVGERSKTVTTFDANGNATSFTPRSGATTRYYYDGMDRPTGVVTDAADGDPAISNWVSYDLLGRPLDTTDADGVVTRQTYVSSGWGAGLPHQIIAQSAPTPFPLLTIEYNQDGTQRLTRDAENIVHTFTYDSLKRPIRTTDPQGIYHEVEYDPNNNIIRETIGKDGYTGPLPTTLFEYDAANRLTRVINVMNGNRNPDAPENYRVTVSYDALGNPLNVIDADGKNVQHSYDSLGRLASVTDALGNTWQYRYDADGNLRLEIFPGNAQFPSRTTTRNWDGYGRLTSIQFGDSLNTSASFAYNANDLRTRMDDSRGGLIFQSTTYSHTAQNRLKRMTFQPTNRTALEIGYAFTPGGKLKTLTYPGSRAVNYTYDELGRMSTVVPWFTSSSNPFRYTWRKDGQLASLSYPNGTVNTVQYSDPSGRMTRLASSGPLGEFIALGYAWTPADNISQISEAQPTPSVPDYGIEMSYNAGNQLTHINGQPVTVDPSGRIVSLPAPFNATVSWLGNDSLATWQRNGNSDTFDYNADGDRTQQSVNGTTTRYLIDDQPELPNIVAESDEAQVPYRFHIYGAQGLLASADTSNTLAGARFHHFNQRGDVLAITNHQGNVVESYGYSPYGRSVASNISSTNPFRMNGRYGVVDFGKGLVTMRARVYAPMIGSFLSRDQLAGSAAEGLTLNRFAYAAGNPLSNVDPSGRVYLPTSLNDVLKQNMTAPFASTNQGVATYKKQVAADVKRQQVITSAKEEQQRRQHADFLRDVAKETKRGLDLASSVNLFPSLDRGLGKVASVGTDIAFAAGEVRSAYSEARGGNPWKMQTWNGYLNVVNTTVQEGAGLYFGIQYGRKAPGGELTKWAFGNLPEYALKLPEVLMGDERGNGAGGMMADFIRRSPTPQGWLLRQAQNQATKYELRQFLNRQLYRTPFF